MKNVTILIPEGDFSLVNVEGLHHIFSETNKVLIRGGKEPLFHLQLVGKKRTSLLKDFFAVHPNFLITHDVKTDILIIPALHGDLFLALERNKDLVAWITQQRNQGAEIISLCTGAFLLASTGLLNGLHCATHWIHAGEFKEWFPDVNLVEDEIMTDENGIYTSGAAYSYLNLILYVLHKYVSHDIIVFLAKVFAIDMGRISQSQFMIFQGYKNHDDQQILKAQEYIEQHYQEKISIELLTQHVCLGRRNFERRFKNATNHSVTEYIQRVKVEAVKKELEKGKKIINEIIYEVGYNDLRSFRDVFRRIVGMSPIEYRNKYNGRIKRYEYAAIIEK